MPEKEKSAYDLVMEILNKHGRPFITLKRFAFLASAETKRKLNIYHVHNAKDIKEILEMQLGDKFIFTQKGAAIYLVVPCEPEELILSELSADRYKSPLEIARSMPFTKKDCKAILNELVNEGRVRVVLNELLEPRLILLEKEKEKKQIQKLISEHTQEKFIEAFKSLDNGRIFVKICDIRKKLNWPREDFDNMLKDLRDKKIIQLHIGDVSLMTPDEVQDCFIDENNFRMGTVTLHV